MRRMRNAKIVATLGPSTNKESIIEDLFVKGVDVFRLNFSHGKQEDHKHCINVIRSLEQKYHHPTAILLDLQGPKLRVGTFIDGKITLKPEQTFCFDLMSSPGNSERVQLPHPEIFAALSPNQHILLDDGKIKLRVIEVGSDFALTEVIIGGILSNRKGVNIPDSLLPIAALTEKDRDDLQFGLELGVDWVALSFVQHAKDISEAIDLIQGRAKLIAKIEKPQAIEELEKIVMLSDGIMVARGDLGVEMPLEDVPVLQRKIIHCCHQYGKPVIVATQMLESMIYHSTPTRAEASDVATAIYEGADGVMLSAETAVGKYPVQAVEMMDRIIKRVESDKQIWSDFYRFENELEIETDENLKISDSIVDAAHAISYSMEMSTIIVFSLSGKTVLRMARSRPKSPILALTTEIKTYRYLSLVWGVHPFITHEVFSFPQMVACASESAQQEGFSKNGEFVCIISGIPFGKSGGGNIIHVMRVTPEDNPGI